MKLHWNNLWSAHKNMISNSIAQVDNKNILRKGQEQLEKEVFEVFKDDKEFQDMMKETKYQKAEGIEKTEFSFVE